VGAYYQAIGRKAGLIFNTLTVNTIGTTGFRMNNASSKPNSRSMAFHVVRCVPLLVVVACPAAQAQTSYPSRAVRIVVPSAPSGGTDLIGRLTAQKAGEAWGQTVIVDNISGGATRIGINTVAKAAADGHTLLLTTVNFAFAPAIYAKLPYDPVNDFIPIVHVANTGSLLVVHPVVPAKNVAELVALAKSKPDELRYGFGGNGSVGHLVGAMFEAQARIKLLQVPYKGTGPSTTALLGGEVHMLIANMASLLPYVKAGRLRGLAVTGATRSRVMPELPTIAASGVAGYEYGGWYGLWAPAKTPGAIVTRINEEFNRVLADAAVKERFAEVAIEPVGGAPDKFAAYLAAELNKWSKVARDAGITAE
jgi:tripartite-type tricarboxylate transporter receptor subunit TctC